MYAFMTLKEFSNLYDIPIEKIELAFSEVQLIDYSVSEHIMFQNQETDENGVKSIDCVMYIDTYAIDALIAHFINTEPNIFN